MPAPSPFIDPPAVPYYPEYALQFVGWGVVRQWEFNGWKPESLSWKKSCYIHGGLSGPGQVLYKGPEAEAFLTSIFVNNFSKFRVGTAKHAIACDEKGLITAHGVLQRLAEDTFRLFVSGPWSLYQHSVTAFDVQQEVQNNFLFQVAGPTSLETLEAATGESLRDINFLRFRQTTVAGHSVQILRVGMAGTLAYELHGPSALGPEVFDAVVKAGQPFGIERLGWQTFPVNHVEGGFPQLFWTFTSALYDDPGYLEFVKANPHAWWGAPEFVGSVDPADRRARYRTPCEVGWQRSVRLDHAFIGRDAVEKELAAPKRTVVTLEWDPEDVLDIYASLLRPGEEYKYLEIPGSPAHRRTYAHADHVLKNGRRVGISSGTVYSYHFRKVISMATIDLDQAEIGNQVVVLWGDFGGRMKEVKARVARFPYLAEGRNQTVDVAGLTSQQPIGAE
ncbi:aminomethyl transferase family protein [Nitrospirillum iridis]|uniref:Glycine cleavage system aminomethyltransferase T n=1 Tax=Nitrospirillum iridis TaxID=765888 RepID=A0A7X0EGS1_9PROT|nr:aminomethyl transferase family protein [Nitrospirillum iridis]MBB6255240.1 glycine cleavage system aminomethyltransferase T [Nitrospirillum iridis]